MTDDTPFRLALGQRLTAALKTITPTNGYHNDLSDFTGDDDVTVPRVYRGRSWFGDNDPIPMVSILEAVNPADELVEPEVDDAGGEYDWHLLIQGFVNDDPVNPTDPAYWLERDVRRALGKERKTIKPGTRATPDILAVSTWAPEGCTVTKMRVAPGVVRPADDVSARAYFWLALTLTIVESEAA